MVTGGVKWGPRKFSLMCLLWRVSAFPDQVWAAGCINPRPLCITMIHLIELVIRSLVDREIL